MQEAAERTLAFTAGMDNTRFLADIRSRSMLTLYGRRWQPRCPISWPCCPWSSPPPINTR
jgi:hypothetical protein